MSFKEKFEENFKECFKEKFEENFDDVQIQHYREHNKRMSSQVNAIFSIFLVMQMHIENMENDIKLIKEHLKINSEF